MYDEGLSDWRVYSAEHSIGHDRQLADVEECQSLVKEATSSDWFQDWFPHAAPIQVVLGGQETPENNQIWSFAQQRGSPRPKEWRISLHPKMFTARIVLHKLAHCVSPVYVSETIANRYRRDIPDAMLRSKHRIHGGCFTAALGVITDHMLPGDLGELADAYRHFEAPIVTLEELRDQLAGQPAILDDEEAFYALRAKESAEIDARYEAEHGEPPKWVIPQGWWGLDLEMMRKDPRRRIDGRLVSKKLVAESISKVMPCKVSHLTALEASRKRPEDPDQLKRAMLMMIFLATDPIWVRYNMGLTRWDCGGITMREARTVNWRWAKTVTDLNRLQRERPPRWFVEGGR